MDERTTAGHAARALTRNSRRPRGGDGSGPRASRRRGHESLVRVRVLLRRRRLDREIARGRPGLRPDTTLRAQQLIQPYQRARLAAALREIVADAESPRWDRPAPAASPLRSAVLDSRDSILGLAERLEWQPAISAVAAARARILLSEGGGPLYNSASPVSLPEALAWISDALGPCPPHA